MEIFLLNDLVVFLFIETILLFLLLICSFSVAKILKNWNFKVTTSLQYSLEKRNYLVNTIIYFTIISKLLLFVFFIKSLGELANVVPGSMCVAGVTGANDYGNVLLLFKVFIVFILAVWLIINKLDLNSKEFLYIKKKYWLFNFLLVLIAIEFVLEIAYFMNIPLKVPVFCCSTIFKADALPLGLDSFGMVGIFYIIFVGLLISNYYKKIVTSFILNTLFMFASYYCVTYFFSTYIYVLPNHQCPFCILQKEYFYIGYILWVSMFLGVFFGMAPFIVESIIEKKDSKTFKYSSFFNTIFVLICTYYVAYHYIKSGVFL